VTDVAATIALGAGVFVATGLDEVFLLAALLAAGHAYRRVLAAYLAALAVLLAVSSGLGALARTVLDVRWLGLLPIALGVRELLEPAEVVEPGTARGGAVVVVLVLLANGGEELAIYAPLFAARSAGEVALLVATQLACAAALVTVARRLVARPAWRPALQRVARFVLPWLLILLGALLLAGIG
jgi:cadmium resistance protein CadD (predicted permease)